MQWQPFRSTHWWLRSWSSFPTWSPLSRITCLLSSSRGQGFCVFTYMCSIEKSCSDSDECVLLRVQIMSWLYTEKCFFFILQTPTFDYGSTCTFTVNHLKFCMSSPFNLTHQYIIVPFSNTIASSFYTFTVKFHLLHDLSYS